MAASQHDLVPCPRRRSKSGARSLCIEQCLPRRSTIRLAYEQSSASLFWPRRHAFHPQGIALLFRGNLYVFQDRFAESCRLRRLPQRSTRPYRGPGQSPKYSQRERIGPATPNRGLLDDLNSLQCPRYILEHLLRHCHRSDNGRDRYPCRTPMIYIPVEDLPPAGRHQQSKDRSRLRGRQPHHCKELHIRH